MILLFYFCAELGKFYFIKDNFILQFVPLTALCIFASCDLIDIHPYDGKIEGDIDINRQNISRIESRLVDRDTICFAVISDTQRWYDETEDEVASINSRSDIDFVIHCGDLSDFGITKEFEWQRDILQKLNIPYVALIGNHDCLGSGKQVYRKMYGNENSSFVAGHTRFIYLDTNSLEFDFSNPVPDLEFIRSFAGDTSVANTVVVMHVGPYDDEFNDNVAEAFNYYIHKLNNPIFCLYGHGHTTKVNDPFGDGLLYYEITCAQKRQYYVIKITKTDYEIETVDY